MNHLFRGSKQLIRELASQKGLTPLQLLSLHKFCKTFGIHGATVFSALMHNDNPSIDNLNFSAPVEPKYIFLYDFIEHFYNNKASSLTDPPIQISSALNLALVQLQYTAELNNNSQKQEVKSKPQLVWTKKQNKVLRLAQEWLRDKDRDQIFYLAGYAGTGKTSLAIEIADFLYNEEGKRGVPRGLPCFGAYTGQASAVMRTKGMTGATTLHSLVYKPVIDESTGKIKGFILNPESPLATASCLIIDEVSFINEELAKDILSFGTPVFVMGDPAQLPPVQGNGFFTARKPNIMLDEHDIVRQAKDSPILYLAHRAREGKTIKPGRYGDDVRVLPPGNAVSDKRLMNHKMVLCGLNATRKNLNNRIRKLTGLFDVDSVFPVKDDILVCLRNNQEKTLLNGTTWKVLATPELLPVRNKKGQGKLKVLHFDVQSIELLDSRGNPYTLHTQCSTHHFDPNVPEPHWSELIGTDIFDFGNARTVHKAQGSQADSVLIVDESHVFKEDSNKHRYTGFTRAERKLTVQLTV